VGCADVNVKLAKRGYAACPHDESVSLSRDDRFQVNSWLVVQLASCLRLSATPDIAKRKERGHDAVRSFLRMDRPNS
jgi:hypothetical protein